MEAFALRELGDGAGIGTPFTNARDGIQVLLHERQVNIRPQRTQIKKRGEMLAAIRRGDTVVTGGGLVGKVTKASDTELEVDLGGGTKVTALRSTIMDVRVKGEPVANENAKK